MPALCKRRGAQRWRAQIKENGRIVAVKWFGTGKKGGPEYKKAVVWEEEAKKELAQAMPTLTESLTVREWANAYLDEVLRRRATSTYTEVKTAFKLMGKTFGPEFPMNELVAGAALQHLDSQKDSRSGNAANRDRKNLARGWDWGRKFMQGFPDFPNPFKAVERYPEARKPRYVPPESDFWKIMAIAEGQDKVILTTFFHLAARRGEVFRLKWSDVDFLNDQIRLSTRKTASGSWKHDWIPMTGELKETLRWWYENRENTFSEYVFTVLDATPFTNQFQGEPFKQRQHFMRKLCKKAGVKSFGYHAIRHLSAVVLYQAGYPVAMIQAILRHENATTTEKYLKRLGLDPDKMKMAVEAFENRGPEKVIPFKRREPIAGVHSSGLPGRDTHPTEFGTNQQHNKTAKEKRA